MGEKSKLFINYKRITSSSQKETNNNTPILNKGPWSEKEDILLKKWVEKNGPCNWMQCSEYIKGRSGKQCREHWNNSLDPNLIKGQWTSEEDILLMIFYKKYGGSWKKIIPIFPKRTENSIKNRFFSQLRTIASRTHLNGKKEYSTKFGLTFLLKYLQHATELAKKKFFEENKMNENELDIYVNKIDFLVKNRKKGNKFIELKSLKENLTKQSKNIIDINEKNEENFLEIEPNLETPKLKTRRRRGKKSDKKIIKEESNINIIKGEEEKEKGKIINENINEKNNKKDDNKTNDINKNKIIQKKPSKNIVFKNEQLENEKTLDKSDKNLLKLPSKDIKKNSDDNFDNNKDNKLDLKLVQKLESNIDNNIDNSINNNIGNYNSFKAVPFQGEANSEDESMEEIDRQIKDAESRTINNHKSHANGCKIKNMNSKDINNRIEQGNALIPFMSFDIQENKEPNIKINKRKSKLDGFTTKEIFRKISVDGGIKSKISLNQQPWMKGVSKIFENNIK